MRMATNQVAAKVWAAAVTAFLVPILLALLARLLPNIPLPVDAGDLLSQIVEGAILFAMTLGAGWIKRPSSQDQVVADRPSAPKTGGIL